MGKYFFIRYHDVRLIRILNVIDLELATNETEIIAAVNLLQIRLEVFDLSGINFEELTIVKYNLNILQKFEYNPFMSSLGTTYRSTLESFGIIGPKIHSRGWVNKSKL